MTDINDIYKSNSDNIKAEDIGNNMWTMTIKTAEVREFKDKDKGIERKIVLTFHEWDKCLPLNVTNARAIAGMYGHNSNAWPGPQIMLFAMMVDFGGKPTLGIRVRAPQPMQPQPNFQQQAPQQPYQPGAMQPQAVMQPGPGFSPGQNSPQRPLGPPQQTYQQASGGNPAPAGQREFAPLPTENPFGGF
jgi:hypothetical protein